MKEQPEMFETCVEIRRHFSDYLDNLCDRDTFRSIRFHVDYCAACARELDLSEQLRSELGSLPRVQVSPQVALQLRVKLSRYLHRNLLARLDVFIENALRPLVLPASAGLLTAIICFSVIMGSQVVPASDTPDVPLWVTTPPRVKALGVMDLPDGDQSVVLVTHVDADGRVTYYRILSGQKSPEMVRHLDRMIYFSLFDPATTSGKRTDGEVVLSLRRITVRG